MEALPERSGDLLLCVVAGPAWIDRCSPDVMITESTCASMTREGKQARELDLLRRVYNCVTHGGCVLIPVFAVGRAQEMCILLDSFWERMGLKVPDGHPYAPLFQR